MKTTNFEISKKLKEIGFEASSDYFYNKDGRKINYWLYEWKSIEDIYARSYDLETLLDALPSKIQNRLIFWINYSHCHDCWAMGYQRRDTTRDVELEIFAEENESLTDCAGRLIIKLYEQEIINFNK